MNRTQTIHWMVFVRQKTGTLFLQLTAPMGWLKERMHGTGAPVQSAQLPNPCPAIICRHAFQASSPKTFQAGLWVGFSVSKQTSDREGSDLGSPMIIERSTVYPQVLRPLSAKLSTPCPVSTSGRHQFDGPMACSTITTTDNLVGFNKVERALYHVSLRDHCASCTDIDPFTIGNNETVSPRI